MPSPRKRVAGAELWRSLAAASAVVERRQASALRLSARRARKRGRMATCVRVARTWTKCVYRRSASFAFALCCRVEPRGWARIRIPGAAQHNVMRCRPGIFDHSSSVTIPVSAAHHCASLRAAPRPGNALALRVAMSRSNGQQRRATAWWECRKQTSVASAGLAPGMLPVCSQRRSVHPAKYVSPDQLTAGNAAT
jgi:hypothetical protein